VKKEQQVYIAIGFGVILGIFIYLKFLLGPVNKNITQTKDKIQQSGQTLAEAKREADNLEILQAQMKVLELEVTDLQQSLPKGKEIPDLLRRVTKIAQRFGVKINNYQLLAIKPGQDYDEFPVTLQISGNFHSIGNFLAELGQEERIFSASNLILTSQSLPKEGITVTGGITIIAYVAKGGA